MNFLKKNLKVIIAFIVGIILASGITIYAYSLSAGEVSYMLEENTISVDEALNNLYAQINKVPSLSSVKGATSANNATSTTVTGLERNNYYVCMVTTRKQGTLSISGVQVLFSTKQQGYLDGNHDAFLALIYSSNTSATFSVSGTQGVQVYCWKLQ